MDSLGKQEQILLLGAFAMSVRSRRFSDLRFNTLAEGTFRGTISYVMQTFQLSGRQNPTKDVQTTSLASFYQGSSGHSEMTTLKRSNKKGPSICSPR